MLRIRITIVRDGSAELSAGDGAPAFAMLPSRWAPSFGVWLPSVMLHAALAGVLFLRAAAPAATAESGAGRQGSPLLLRLNGKTYYVSQLHPGEGLSFGNRLRARGTGMHDRGSERAGGRLKDRSELMVSVDREQKKRSPVTVVRDDVAPTTEVQENVRVPNLAVWTAEVPTSSPRTPVEPGRRASETQLKHTDTAEVPQSVVAEQNESTPVRAFTASVNPQPTSSAVTIPAANTGGSMTGSTSIAGGSAAAGSSTKAAADAVAGSSVGAAVPASSAGRVSAEAGAARDVPVVAASSQPEVTVAIPPAASTPAPAVITIRRPESGNFDAVVVQTSGAELFDGRAGVLSGKPVYTVYVPVGTRKDWILQYCLPTARKGSEEQMSGPVVRLTAEAPIEAPWPTLIQRVPVVFPPGERYLILHGYVNTAGRIEQLKVVRAGLAGSYPALLAVVSGWEFRPARQGSSPVAVEVLLAIPADAA